MKKREADRIRNLIRMCEVKLHRLEPYLNGEKPALNEAYNKILIEKAVLRDKLQQKELHFLAKFADRLIPKMEKNLICDYFK